MKHLLTLCLAGVCVLGLHSQSFFQDFENGMDPMKLYDLDGLTPHANVGQYTEAWNVRNVAFGNGTFVAISNSWYEPIGTANDWMVTPAIQLPDSGAVIRWEAKAQDPSWRDGYIVYISTTGDTPDDFETILFQTPAELSQWTTRIVPLDEYAGQEVYVAFRNNSNDKFLLLVDNIFIGETKQRDISLRRVNANINRGTTLQGTRQIEITIQNFGAEAINSLEVVWEMDGEFGVHEVEGLNIPTGGSYTFMHSEPIEFKVGTGYTLNVEVSAVNGHPDDAPDDNLYTSGEFKVFPPVPNFQTVSSKGVPIDLHEIMLSRKVIIFDFFASWCVPCEISTPALNNLYVNNGGGEEDLMVIGITIEPTDHDEIINGLPWGATYPKLSYSSIAEEMWTHYNNNHGLGENAIPLFVMICPNLEDPSQSEIIASYIGAGDIENVFNNTWQPMKDECAASIVSSVPEITAIEAYTISPNPAIDYVEINLMLNAPLTMSIEVVDVTGRIMLQKLPRQFQTGRNHELIDLRGFASGTYFVRLTEQNAVKTLKFNVTN